MPAARLALAASCALALRHERHERFTSSRPSCTKASTVIVTIAAGPLNYAGVNPKVACTA